MTIKTNEMIILDYHNLQLYTGDDWWSDGKMKNWQDDEKVIR